MKLVAVDLETTGVSFLRDYIYEFGLVIEEGSSVTEYSFCIPLRQPMPKEADAVNHYTERKEAGLLPPTWDTKFAFSTVLEILDEAVIVGHNVHFDMNFITMWFSRFRAAKPNWNHRLIDVGSLLLGRYPHVKYPVSSTEALELSGVKNAGRHTALGDARWAYEVFRSVVPQ